MTKRKLFSQTSSRKPPLLLPRPRARRGRRPKNCPRRNLLRLRRISNLRIRSPRRVGLVGTGARTPMLKSQEMMQPSLAPERSSRLLLKLKSLSLVRMLVRTDAATSKRKMALLRHSKRSRCRLRLKFTRRRSARRLTSTGVVVGLSEVVLSLTNSAWTTIRGAHRDRVGGTTLCTWEALSIMMMASTTLQPMLDAKSVAEGEFRVMRGQDRTFSVLMVPLTTAVVSSIEAVLVTTLSTSHEGAEEGTTGDTTCCEQP